MSCVDRCHRRRQWLLITDNLFGIHSKFCWNWSIARYDNCQKSHAIVCYGFCLGEEPIGEKFYLDVFDTSETGVLAKGGIAGLIVENNWSQVPPFPIYIFEVWTKEQDPKLWFSVYDNLRWRKKTLGGIERYIEHFIHIRVGHWTMDMRWVYVGQLSRKSHISSPALFANVLRAITEPNQHD